MSSEFESSPEQPPPREERRRESLVRAGGYPDLPDPAPESEPDVPGEEGISGQQRQGIPEPVHRSGLRRNGGQELPSDPPGKRTPLSDDPSRDRREDPYRPGQDQRLRLFLPPERDQASAGRPARTVDLRWGGVQLAATPSSLDLHAGGLPHRIARRRQPDGLAQRARADEPDEGHGRHMHLSG